MNTKNNLYFRINEENIQNALLQLLENYDIDQITVKQICAVSHINRSTFYAHYSDIFSLICSIEKKIHHQIISKYQNLEKAGEGILDGSFYHDFLENIRNYKNFFKASLKKRNTFPLEEGYEEIMNYIIKPFCEKMDIVDETAITYHFVFYQAGFTHILKYWVEHDCVESTDTIEGYFRKLIPYR